MLTEVVLQSSNPMTLKIDDVDPDEILILTSISGLTPQDVQTYTGEFGRSGGYYQGRRFGFFYPVFNFKLQEDYALGVDISQVRDMLYRQFYNPQASGDGLTVVLKDDKFPDRFFTCYAEKWQGDIFEKTTKGQISTKVVDAHIKSVDSTIAVNPAGWLAVPIDYDGSADTGFKLDLKVVIASTQITIDNNGEKMILIGTFAANDVITINTTEGQRYIRQNGVDVMALLQAPANWLQLKQAANVLRVYSTAVGDGKIVSTRYEYQSEWIGV